MNILKHDLENRHVVMISDYVGEGYDEEDIQEEKEFLQLVKKQLQHLKKLTILKKLIKVIKIM